MANNVASVNWHRSNKCPAGSYALLAGRGMCHVLATDGLDRIVGFREHKGSVVTAVTERIAVQWLRPLDPVRDLTGSPSCATLRT